MQRRGDLSHVQNEWRSAKRAALGIKMLEAEIPVPRPLCVCAELAACHGRKHLVDHRYGGRSHEHHKDCGKNEEHEREY